MTSPHDLSTFPIHESISALDHEAMELITLPPSTVHQAHIFSADYLARRTENTICGRHPIGALLGALAVLQEEHAKSPHLNWVKYEQCFTIKDSSYASAYVRPLRGKGGSGERRRQIYNNSCKSTAEIRGYILEDSSMIWEPTGSSFSFSVPGWPGSLITYGKSVNCEGRASQMIIAREVCKCDGTDLSVGNRSVLKSPELLQSVFQMTTAT